MSRARLVPLALMVTLLLAVVAVVARGRPLGGSAGGRGGLPISFWEYTYTTVVIAVVPLMLAGLVAASLIRRRQGKKRSYWQSLLISLGTWVAVVAVALVVVPHLHPRLPHHVQEPPHLLRPVGNDGRQQHRQHPAAASHTLRFRWGEAAVVLGVLVLAGAIIVARLARSGPRRPREIAPETLAAALDDSLDDLRTDPDLRRAIVAAYARMERVLAAAGVPRHRAEAPHEYLERALLSLDTSAEAVRRLTDLFEWARFSHHEPEPSMRDDAVDALAAVRDELRASELTPA